MQQGLLENLGPDDDVDNEDHMAQVLFATVRQHLANRINPTPGHSLADPPPDIAGPALADPANPDSGHALADADDDPVDPGDRNIRPPFFRAAHVVFHGLTETYAYGRDHNQPIAQTLLLCVLRMCLSQSSNGTSIVACVPF